MILSVFKNDESETLINRLFAKASEDDEQLCHWNSPLDLEEDLVLNRDALNYLNYKLGQLMSRSLSDCVFEPGSLGEQFEIMLKSFFNSKSNLECPDPLVTESILHIAFIDLKGSIIIVSEIPLTEDI